MLSAVYIIILLATLDLVDLSNPLQENRFSLPPSGCVCPESELSFECSINGTGATVWRASFIKDCHRSSDVTLNHDDNFTTRYQACNGGAITVKAMSRDSANLIYTSRFIINLTMTTLSNGSMITCAHYTDIERDVNTWTMIDSPMNLHLEEVNTTHLKFSWDPLNSSLVCPPFRYNIHATNCGSCHENIQLCSIAVQSKCNEEVGNMSSILQVVLKVPEAPLLLISKNALLQLSVTIKEVAVPNLPGPDSYTIIYTDADSGMKCNTTIIPASHCEQGVYKHILEDSSCSPDANIMVTAFATNMFGESPPTIIIFADGVNKLFDINDKREIVCEYSNEPTKLNGFTKLSISNSTYGINCENLFGKADSDNNILGDSTTTTPNDVSRCYFVIFERNGTMTVIIEGTLDSDKSNETAIEVTALLTIILLVGFLVIMLIFIKQSCRGHKRYQSLKGMNVFVEDKPGSLVKVLYAFQEKGISISCVDTIQRQSGEKPKGFHIVYECSRREHVDVEALCSRIRQCVGPGAGVDVEPLHSHVSESDESDLTKRGSRTTLEFTVNHVCGALIRVLTILNDNGININYLNTLNQDKSDEYREFIVEGHIFKFTRESLRIKLEKCGLRSAKFLAKACIIRLEPGIELNVIKYQVENSIGCFYTSLKELDEILKSHDDMEIKHYDREIPLIDLVPGDANKPHHVCLVCAYSTREKQTIEERIREKFKEISIEPLNQNAIRKFESTNEVEITATVSVGSRPNRTNV